MWCVPPPLLPPSPPHLLVSILITGARVKSFGGNDDIMILLDDVKCDGTESDLLLCRGHTGTNDCTHYEDVGVECRGQTWPGVCVRERGGSGMHVWAREDECAKREGRQSY